MCGSPVCCGAATARNQSWRTLPSRIWKACGYHLLSVCLWVWFYPCHSYYLVYCDWSFYCDDMSCNLRPLGADCLRDSGSGARFRDARKITSLTPETDVPSVDRLWRVLNAGMPSFHDADGFCTGCLLQFAPPLEVFRIDFKMLPGDIFQQS